MARFWNILVGDCLNLSNYNFGLKTLWKKNPTISVFFQLIFEPVILILKIFQFVWFSQRQKKCAGCWMEDSFYNPGHPGFNIQNRSIKYFITPLMLTHFSVTDSLVIPKWLCCFSHAKHHTKRILPYQTWLGVKLFPQLLKIFYHFTSKQISH